MQLVKAKAAGDDDLCYGIANKLITDVRPSRARYVTTILFNI